MLLRLHPPLGTGRYLWFSYIGALQKYFAEPVIKFRDQVLDMAPPARAASVARLRGALLALRPHPHAAYHAIEHELPALETFVPGDRVADEYAGASEDQLRELARDPLFTLGLHTSDHPMLSWCDDDELDRQLSDNLQWLHRLTGQRPLTGAYPSGDYDVRTINACKALGLTNSYAVVPSLQQSPQFEIPRVGIYGSAVGFLAFKSKHGQLVRNLGLKIG